MMTQPRPLVSNPRNAFTLLELLVAMFVAGIMIWLTNLIFQNTTQAVQRGLATSEIITDARGASTQIIADINAMVGPQDVTAARGGTDDGGDNGGVLAIVNHRVLAQERTPPNGDLVTGAELRSDQLMFFRSINNNAGDRILPVVPQPSPSIANSFAVSGRPFESDHVKIWYGHGLLTLEDGTVEPASDRLGSGINNTANQWILARQAMFLVDEQRPSPPGLNVTLESQVHSNTAAYNGIVAGYGNPTSTTTPPNTELPRFAYSGLNDMAGQTLGAVGETAGSGDPPLEQDSILETLNNAIRYEEAALDYAYLKERIRLNPEPFIDAADEFRQLNSWQIAQMHPIFLTGVADFIVEFAADTDLDGNVDRKDPATSGNTPETSPTAASQVMWYTHDEFANFEGGPNFDADRPVTYSLPAGTYRSEVYRDTTDINNFSPTPRELDAANNNMGAFVWRHDDEGGTVTGAATPQPSFWPFLLRIRYRMVSESGRVQSGTLDGEGGVWFEHIVRVNRP